MGVLLRKIRPGLRHARDLMRPLSAAAGLDALGARWPEGQSRSKAEPVFLRFLQSDLPARLVRYEDREARAAGP